MGALRNVCDKQLAFTLLTSNLLRFGSVDRIGHSSVFIGKLIVCSTTCLIAWFLSSQVFDSLTYGGFYEFDCLIDVFTGSTAASNCFHVVQHRYRFYDRTCLLGNEIAYE